ncbi:hypothetical protein BN159_0157 [Streptomyces davaonensis JCM 4913]|uniref:Hemerythrin-like domain-containing protein n=1 Tax=Streptomyces davaonensis (strain DSM 101723 / JCM 4913 / KCC S-0913 / 768) TaxID=1214101 RepID=K4QSF0_STRDJ|nr:hemerythrin domain-containing protein [Streptomyces davaonensis]CCK24536.1 hypothetical protein BN159_0157 [Streptomyces davaonensis JCM 4913]
MTSSNTSGSTVHPYTREMAMVHRVFRRESRLLAELVQGVSPGDSARCLILAEHWRLYAEGLHTHHAGEDELLWPVLLPRLHLAAEQVWAMQAQHRALDEGIAAVHRLMDRWQPDARPEVRDELAEALRQHHLQLCSHFDEEEREVMPLVALHVTEQQWHAVGERGLAETPRNRLMIALGAILEDSPADERREFLARLPLPARLLWKLLGQRQYRREIQRVRGGYAAG